MRRTILALLILLPFQRLYTQVQQPQADLLHQYSLELASRLNVLMISLQPGFEDLATLSYLRYGKGAKVLSAYVTNGEGGESDQRSMIPNELAAERRREAFAALAAIGGETWYLNMPDIPAARDTTRVRTLWDIDTLTARLTRLMTEFKPDLILLTRDWEAKGKSSRWIVTYEELLKAVQRVEPVKGPNDPLRFAPIPRWQVGRVLVDDGITKGLSAPIELVHQRSGKSYHALGEEAAAAYRSLIRQRSLWSRQSVPSYVVHYPALRQGSTQRFTSIEQGLPSRVSPKLRSLEQQIRAIANRGMALRTALRPQRPLLRQILGVMDSLDLQLSQLTGSSAADRRTLLHWKSTLENLRVQLLGVSVASRLSDSILTEVQLTYLHIDSISRLPRGGRTEIYIPGIDQGWIVNENMEKRLPYEPGMQMRLLSPRTVTYTYPHHLYGLRSETYVRPFYVFVIHRGASREESFVYRMALRFFFAPRFTTEILTPIVFAVENEPLVVRLTNHSRDGVRDTLIVRDSVVISHPSPFRLNEKGMTHLDTLRLRWQRKIEHGTHLFPVRIRTEPVAQFAVRSFDVALPATRKVVLLPSLENSPTAQTLRRLGIRFEEITSEASFDALGPDVSTILVDRRALSRLPWLHHKAEGLKSFAEAGGRVVILAQDEEVWNETPLLAGLTLTRTLEWDEETEVNIDTSHALVATPNRITPEDFNNWIFERAFNRVEVSAELNAEQVVTTWTGKIPLVVTAQVGRGNITYVDLSLHHQFLNVHAGSFRLLANILAY